MPLFQGAQNVNINGPITHIQIFGDQNNYINYSPVNLPGVRNEAEAWSTFAGSRSSYTPQRGYTSPHPSQAFPSIQPNSYRLISHESLSRDANNPDSTVAVTNQLPSPTDTSHARQDSRSALSELRDDPQERPPSIAGAARESHTVLETSPCTHESSPDFSTRYFPSNSSDHHHLPRTEPEVSHSDDLLPPSNPSEIPDSEKASGLPTTTTTTDSSATASEHPAPSFPVDDSRKKQKWSKPLKFLRTIQKIATISKK